MWEVKSSSASTKLIQTHTKEKKKNTPTTSEENQKQIDINEDVLTIYIYLKRFQMSKN